jgi:hypothetical protein
MLVKMLEKVIGLLDSLNVIETVDQTIMNSPYDEDLKLMVARFEALRTFTQNYDQPASKNWNHT